MGLFIEQGLTEGDWLAVALFYVMAPRPSRARMTDEAGERGTFPLIFRELQYRAFEASETKRLVVKVLQNLAASC